MKDVTDIQRFLLLNFLTFKIFEDQIQSFSDFLKMFGGLRNTFNILRYFHTQSGFFTDSVKKTSKFEKQKINTVAIPSNTPTILNTAAVIV